MERFKAMFWPLALLLGMLVGHWIGKALDLPELIKFALIVLGAFGGFMIVVLTARS